MITVRVPATTANLGPGFDCMGLAFSLYGVFDFEESGSGLSFDGVEAPYQNENNLAVRAYFRALSALGETPRGLFLRIRSDIPVSRGLGSSASLIAAGLTAANAAHGGKLDRQALLALATELEGHPDNVAPALLGGLTVSMQSEAGVLSQKCALSPLVRFCVLIPDFELSTQKARAVLPQQVPFADAVFNAAHALALLRALETGDFSALSLALRDRLHEPYREGLIPGFSAVKSAALKCGACAVCISGAGPSVLCLHAEEDFPERLIAALGDLAAHWRVLPLSVDLNGARIL